MTGTRYRSASWHTLWFVAILAAAAGCTRAGFRHRADRDVENLLNEKTQDPRWQLDSWYVYPDSRARFADVENPDRPKKPPDDPAAAALAPDPQPLRGRFHSGPYQEGLGYLEFLRYCDQHNRSLQERPPLADSKPLAKLGNPASQPGYNSATTGIEAQSTLEKALRTEESAFLLTLEQTLELSLFNSRDFQDTREDLYAAALPVTLQRFNFLPQVFAGVEAVRSWTGRDIAGGPGSLWTINSTDTVTQLFPTGASAILSFANRVVIELGSGNPQIGVSNLSLRVVQPFLQGGGWAVTMEPLTQAERTFIYGVRSYARFRKIFYVFLAGGGELSNSPTGFDGLNVTSIGATLRSPSQGYLPTLLITAFERNERDNIRALMTYLALYREYQGRGDFNELQVGQVEQQILGGQRSLLQRQKDLQDGLDNFKLQLGVPTTMPIELEDGPIAPMRGMLEKFAKARDEFQSLRGDADRIRNTQKLPLQALAGSAVAPVRLEVSLREIAEIMLLNSAVTKATKNFRDSIPGRWNRWRVMTTDQIRAEIKQQNEELRRLQVLEAKLQAANEQLSPTDAARLDGLPKDIGIGQLELSLRVHDAAVGKKDHTPRGSALLYEEVLNNFIRVMSEAREERRVLLREAWPKLPSVTVDGEDLLKIDLDRAQTIAAQAALANRLDLMNSRGRVVDAWRRISVIANSLLAVANVGYNLDTNSPPGLNDPFVLGGSRTTHELVLNGELPLVRRAERNQYRIALIAYQRARRQLQATEDFILNDVRVDLRNLRLLAENYRIEQRRVELAYDQVENSLDVLQAPPIPEGVVVGQPGRAAAQSQQQAASAAALTSQLLGQQTALLQAQNSLYQVWVNYLVARMTFYRDIEQMQLDSRGAWIDELSTPTAIEPETLPQPGAGGDPSTGRFADDRGAGDR